MGKKLYVGNLSYDVDSRDFTDPGTSVIVDGGCDALVTALPLVPLKARD